FNNLFAQFPQDKVNRAISNYYQNENNTAKKNITQQPLQNDMYKNSLYLNTNSVLQDREDFVITGDKSTLYIGPEPDTFFVYTNFVQIGDIITLGQGVLLVDGATLTLYGHLNQFDNSKVILQNNALLNVPQQYNSHYLHQLQDNASFESTNSIVDANFVYQIRQYDNSHYIAKQTFFPVWNFRKIWDKSELVLEDVNMVGDLTINDSCQVSFTRCDTILPWFGTAAGDTLDYNFPDWDTVNQYVFDSNLNGINGINYSVSFDNCKGVMWGLESWRDSYIKIDSSFISIAFRIYEDVTITGIEDYTFYWNLIFPFNDRFCQITKSYLHMWFPYIYDTAVVYIDNCRYAESKAHNQSEMYVTNTISDGFPSCTSPVDNGFLFFSDGIVRTFSSSWFNATLLLNNTCFDPRPDHRISYNIAHDESYFLAVNCTFIDSLKPYALDASLVMFTAIDSLSDNVIGTTVDVLGSAWIDAGPQNPVTFDCYNLFWSPAGDSVWTLLEESTNQVDSDVLATWNTTSLSAGKYNLRLTITDSFGDSLTAYKTI
ncbi:MAG: hypothetical protein K8R37_12025, partial [Bacteroidales bacterium]|nr:hypothetical protein [Bacteroidales bacterium]